MTKRTVKSNPREDWVHGIVDATKTGRIEVAYDFATDRIELVGAEPGSTKVVRSYKRASGKEDKVVASVPHAAGAPFDPDDALRSFECVVAMDTNKRTIAGKECAACFSYYLPVKFTEHKGDIPYYPLTAYFIVGIDKGVNAERIGWHLTLTNNIMPAFDRALHGRLALITDSELGLHASINARKVGYYRDHMLPDWATLVYGSDRETDTLGGTMLKACHKGATEILIGMKKRARPFENVNTPGEGFESFAQLDFKRA